MPRGPLAWPRKDRELVTGTQPGCGPSQFQPLPGVLDKPNPRTRAETPFHHPYPTFLPTAGHIAYVPQGTLGSPSSCCPHSRSRGAEILGTPPTSWLRTRKAPWPHHHPPPLFTKKKLSLVLADRSHAGESSQGVYIPSVHKSRTWGMCSAKASGPPRPRSLWPHQRPAVWQDAASHGPPCTAQPCSQKTIPTACLQPLVLCDRKINQQRG